MMALICKSLKEYSDNRGIKDFKYITITSSFSLVNFPNSKEEITGGNNFVPQYLQIPVTHSFMHNLKGIKSVFASILGGSSLIGTQRLFEGLNSLPFNLAKLTVHRLS